MKTMYDIVGEFHRKFGLPVAGGESAEPGLPGYDVFLFRYRFLQEEMNELLRAYHEQDLTGVADALADLTYVALGTAHFCGLPFNEVFAEVQRANMQKERASGSFDNRSKRGHALDVVKPEGWQPPDVVGALSGKLKIQRPTVVCLCGSTRFYEVFQKANYQETMAGRVVLSVGFYLHCSEQAHGQVMGCTDEQKAALDELHLHKIDLADEVLVLDVGGYIGSSTQRELEYASRNKKRVRFWSQESSHETVEGCKTR